MKISIQSSERFFSIKFPTTLLCNAITAVILCKKAHSSTEKQKKEQKEIEINSRLSYPQARQLMKALRKCQKALDETPFVEIETKDGEKITILL